MSINCKELLAIYYGLKCYARKLKGECVLINSDNTTAVSCIAKKGSSSDWFKDEVIRKIYKIGEKFNFEIKICHLAGVLNGTAADASR